METKHTPGEWLVEELMVYALDTEKRCNRFSAQVQGGYVSARDRSSTGRTSEAELRANARLIAAAPELLAALKVWQRADNIGGDDDEAVDLHLRLLGEACALRDEAILKAEGGEP